MNVAGLLDLLPKLLELLSVGERIVGALGIVARRVGSLDEAVRLANKLPPPVEIEDADWDKAVADAVARKEAFKKP